MNYRREASGDLLVKSWRLYRSLQ